MELGQILEEQVVCDFRKLFYEITGMATSFSLPGFKDGQQDFTPQDAKLRFCRIIHGCPKGLAMCQRSDQAAAEMVKEKQTPIIYPCHAGITGIAVPVLFGDRFLGTVYAGDVLTSKPTKAQFTKICKRLSSLDIDFAELEKAYHDIPVVPRRTIKIGVDLLSLIVNYIVDREQIISLQEAIYKKQNEVADALAARTEIEKGLQSRVEEVQRLRKQLLTVSNLEKTAVLTENDDTRTKRIIKDTLSFIDNYFSEDITLKDVADHVGLSPSYLSTIFRREYGCTFIEYLVRKRINKACELLQDLRLNVTQVSMRVGYYNISYFNQLFKKIMGMSPGKYRNRVSLPDEI